MQSQTKSLTASLNSNNATPQPLARIQWRTVASGLLVNGLLVLLYALVNWHWLRQNVVIYGWDRLDHLIASLAYNDIFQGSGPRAWYAALSYADYYPPLVHWIVVLAYRFFGVDEDIAVMTNLLYLAPLLGATWWIARRLAGERTAGLASVILATFPMIYAMSRYLYLDFALTALVALTLALLLATERFQRRNISLLFGLSLGLAFWVKWTAASFLAAPLLFMLWRSGVLITLIQQPRRLRPHGKRLLLALLAASLLNGLWLYPAWDLVRSSHMGGWLFLALTLPLAFALYALFAVQRNPLPAARPVINALRAGALAAWVMALWYLTNSEFLASFFYHAYGREDGRFWAYGKYLNEVTVEQISPLYTLVLVGILMAGLLWWRPGWKALPRLGDTGWVLLLWVVAPYVIFSSDVSLAHSRFVMPFLPPFAIWIARGLQTIPRPRLRWGVIGLVLILAWGQFVLISFDPLSRERALLQVTPTFNLLAHGFFIQYPASEETDPGYAITDNVLTLVEQGRQRQGKERINLGLLVNSYQLHEKHFLYQIYVRYHQVTLRELARNWRDQPAYNQLFDMDYVLVSDQHTFRTGTPSQEAVDRILNQPDDLFNRTFVPVQQWTFPNQEHLTLFTRRFAPTEPGIDPAHYQQLLTWFADRLGTGDALLLAAPDQAYMLGLMLPANQTAELLPLPTADAAMLQTLAQAAKRNQRLFLIDHNAQLVDPTGQIEAWLHAHAIAGSDAWAGSVRVTPFIPVAPELISTTLTATWSAGAQLRTLIQHPLPGQRQPTVGGTLVYSLDWAKPCTVACKVSLQLLSADGRLIAQADRDLAEPQDYVLLLPRSLTAGTYTVTALLYDPASAKPFALSDGQERLTLQQVQIHQP